MLIVFEGLDCTGKTSVARGLAEKLSQPYNKSPSLVSKIYTSGVTYLADFLIDEHRIIRPALKHHTLLQDRYFFSVLSYNAAITQSRRLRRAIPLFTKPDLIFYLRADEEIKKERWFRGGKKGFSLLFHDLGLAKRVDQEYRSLFSDYQFRVNEIDTTQLSVEQAVEKIYAIL